MKTLRLDSGYLGHHFGDLGVQGGTWQDTLGSRSGFYCFFHGFWGPLGTQFGPSFVIFADLFAPNCSIGSRVDFLRFEAGNCTRIRYLDVLKT